MSETVTVIRDGQPTGETDRYGHPILGDDVERDEPGAWFAPAGSTEPVAADRRAVITTDTVYWRRVVDVTAKDRLRVRGVVREVDGDPQPWRHGGFAGTVVRLKTVAG